MSPDADDESWESPREEGIHHLRSSETAKAIVRELAQDDLLRTTDMLERIDEKMGVTRSNFYDFLNRLEGAVIEERDGPGRASLYTLTELGKELAAEFGLSPTTNQLTDVDRIEIATDDSLVSCLRKVKRVKNATPDDLELALERLRREVEEEGERATTRRTTGGSRSQEDDSISETTNH